MEPSNAGAGYLDEVTGAWKAVPSTAESVEQALTLSVIHMSWYQPWTWDLGSVKSHLEQFFGRLVGYGVALRTDPPHCRTTPLAVVVTVTGGRPGDPSLDGCAEDTEASQIRLRIVNNRPYGVVVTAPANSQQERISQGGLLSALYQAKWLTDVGGDYLPAGGEADYLLASSGPDVEAIGTWSWKTYVLDSAVAFLLILWGSGKPPADAAAAAKAPADATKVPSEKLAKVGKCLGDKMFSDPPENVRDAIAENIECLGELEDLLLAPLALLHGLLGAIAGALDAGQDLAAGSKGTVTVQRGLALTANAFGPVPFGTPTADAESTLETLLGPSTGISDGGCDLDGPPTEKSRFVFWGRIAAIFSTIKPGGSESGPQVLIGWQVDSGPGSPAVSLPHGIGIGAAPQLIRSRSKVVQERAGYPYNWIIETTEATYTLDSDASGLVVAIGRNRFPCE